MTARAWPRAVAVIALLAVLALAGAATPSPRASAAVPAFSGTAFGVELCPQQLCGAATFLGYFGGDVDGRQRGGWWVIAARHDELPAAGGTSAVTGGRWSLSIAGERSGGAVIGGTIRNNGDETFAIAITLGSADGGAPLGFTGTLSHRAFPPIARGTIGAAASVAAR